MKFSKTLFHVILDNVFNALLLVLLVFLQAYDCSALYSTNVQCNDNKTSNIYNRCYQILRKSNKFKPMLTLFPRGGGYLIPPLTEMIIAS